MALLMNVAVALAQIGFPGHGYLEICCVHIHTPESNYNAQIARAPE
jgi:hypothetical protein